LYYIPGVGTMCTVSYSPKCQFCDNVYTMPVNNGGSIRHCGVCSQTFNAQKVKYPAQKCQNKKKKRYAKH
jgi:hypothetical protein